jgi:hypothetical protein
MQKLEGAKVCNNGGSGGSKELVNSKIPHYPPYIASTEATWPETWRKEWKRQPTNGQRNCEITALPMSNGRRRNQNYTQCNYINDVTRVRVKGDKIMAMKTMN